MEENDENEIRRRAISTSSAAKTDGATLEMSERKKSDVTTMSRDESSRIPFMIEQHSQKYTTNISTSSSNDSTPFLKQGTLKRY